MKLSITPFHSSPRSICANRYMIAHAQQVTLLSSIGMRIQSIQDHGSLILIADGLAGLANDRIAAECALELFHKFYTLTEPIYEISYLKDFVYNAHHEIRNAITEKNMPLMGCSIVLIWEFQDQMMWLSLGDAYLLHQHQDKCVQINHRHTLAEFARRQWIAETAQEQLAQAWFFGSKIPNNTNVVVLTDEFDFGYLNVQRFDSLLLCNNDFGKENPNWEMNLKLETLKQTFSRNPNRDWTAVHINIF